MQKKVNFLYLYFCLALSLQSFAQNELSSVDLKQAADSLFKAKNYTDAKLLYDDLYFTKKNSSNDLLLKLAFINEGLGEVAWTQYFLEKYVIKFPTDEQTHEKILNNAEKYELSGYTQTDLSSFINMISPYKISIISFLFSSLIIMLLISIILKKVVKFIPVIIIFSILTVLCSFLFQRTEEKTYGVIIKKSLLMSEPSAAGDLVYKVTPGHKVQMLEEKDVWNKIRFQNKDCYILKSNIAEL